MLRRSRKHLQGRWDNPNEMNGASRIFEHEFGVTMLIEAFDHQIFFQRLPVLQFDPIREDRRLAREGRREGVHERQLTLPFPMNPSPRELETSNVEVTGSVRLHRAASHDRRGRGRPPGWTKPLRGGKTTGGVAN